MMPDRSKLIIAGVIAAAAAILLLLQAAPARHPGEPSGAWYLDLNSQTLFTAPIASIPPVEAPSGLLEDGSPAGVRAFVFACASCESDDDRTIGYLQKHTLEGRQSLLDLRRRIAETQDAEAKRALLKNYSDIEEQSIRVRRMDEQAWHPPVGDIRSQVIAEIRSRCAPDQPVIECQPE